MPTTSEIFTTEEIQFIASALAVYKEALDGGEIYFGDPFRDEVDERQRELQITENIIRKCNND